MGYETLLKEDQGPVRTLTLNRPEIFNPLDHISGPEVVNALEEADRQESVRTLVLTGAGKAFSGGGNVRLMRQTLKAGERASAMFAEVAGLLNRSIIALRRISKPVVCALNGVAAGAGVAWALACDLVVASEEASLDPAYIRIGLSPDGGLTATVPRLIGYQRASEFFLRGRPLKAQRALELGMVNRVVPPAEVLPVAQSLAAELAAGPAQAIAITKALLNRAVLGDLETVLENERQQIMSLSEQPDFAEGIEAFFAKRPPRFA